MLPQLSWIGQLTPCNLGTAYSRISMGQYANLSVIDSTVALLVDSLEPENRR
jgi:hypothetical protein